MSDIKWYNSEKFKFDEFQAYYDFEHDFGKGNYKNSVEQAFSTAWEYQEQKLQRTEKALEVAKSTLIELKEYELCDIEPDLAVTRAVNEAQNQINEILEGRG